MHVISYHYWECSLCRSGTTLSAIIRLLKNILGQWLVLKVSELGLNLDRFYQAPLWNFLSRCHRCSRMVTVHYWFSLLNSTIQNDSFSMIQLIVYLTAWITRNYYYLHFILSLVSPLPEDDSFLQIHASCWRSGFGSLRKLSSSC